MLNAHSSPSKQYLIQNDYQRIQISQLFIPQHPSKQQQFGRFFSDRSSFECIDLIKQIIISKISCMPKVETIINQITKSCPQTLPEISQVFESDPDRILQALRERGKEQSYYVLLRILHYKALKMLRPQERTEFLKPLLELNPKDLGGNLKIQAILHICEGIIEAEDQFRTSTIEKYISDMSKLPLTINHLARLEAISAGNNCLKGDYVHAAAQYLSSSRMEAFVKDDRMKTTLVEKAIAFAFISPIGQESHKIICALCMNETAKKSDLFPFLSKLYRQDIITQQEVSTIAPHLPNILKEKDREGVSILEQSAFSRNMIPIINSFSTIKLATLLRLSGVPSEDMLLILLEKTYRNGEVSIDQIKGLINIQDKTDPSEIVKDFLNQIDVILAE